MLRSWSGTSRILPGQQRYLAIGGIALERDTVMFSLILATVGRVDELERFLRHLDQQTYRNFELIIVDQNPDGILDSLVRRYQDRFLLIHLRSERGLSRARNVGLKHISGNLVAFPDDDCWYSSDLLEKVKSSFCQNLDWDGITGRPVDERRPNAYPRFPRVSGWVDKKNVWRRGISFTIFLRASVVRAIGNFDESLGAGSASGKLSAEETDYLIRTVENGFRIHYCSDLSVFHPYPTSTSDRYLVKRAYGYSVGFGYVLRKHNYPFSSVFYHCLRAFGGAVVSLMRFNFAKSQYHFATLKGRVQGWLG